MLTAFGPIGRWKLAGGDGAAAAGGGNIGYGEGAGLLRYNPSRRPIWGHWVLFLIWGG